VNGEDETKANETVIIRRRPSGDDGGGKGGGVWKIAYADFMTAMMAFFLVMWLINSTDKKVVTQLANYFNPMRLTNKTPTQRGVHEGETGAPDSQQTPATHSEQDSKAKAAHKTEPGKAKYTEETLFKDPYGVLSKLAGQAGSAPKSVETSPKNGVEAPAFGTAVYRDPFDPESRRETVPAPVRAEQPADSQQKLSAEAKLHEDAEPTQSDAIVAERAAGQSVEAKSSAEKRGEPEDPAKAAAIAEGQRALAEAAKVKGEIEQALKNASLGVLPGIDVTVTEDGTLITLMDEHNFGMFAIASAEPRPATVVVMEKIAGLLAGRRERLVVRGHTDGRPYRSQSYDNWRLSTARAHMARYMLVRGGIDDQRFDRIEGHADRDLRIRDNPEAAPNRRIEILLRKGVQP
jgi:chemotaxis protein MotB